MTALHIIAIIEAAACGFFAGRALRNRRNLGFIFWSWCASAIVIFVGP